MLLYNEHVLQILKKNKRLHNGNIFIRIYEFLKEVIQITLTISKQQHLLICQKQPNTTKEIL